MRAASISNIDLPLILCTLLAAALGIVMVFSATNASGATSFSLNEFVTRQMIYAAIGIVLMLAIARFDYRMLESLTIPFFMVVIGLLALVAVLGMVEYGSQRWINLGLFPIQPSELAKLSVILVLAKFLAAHENEMHRIKWFVGAGLLVMIPAGIVLEQPDMGTGSMLIFIFLGMTVAARVPARTFIMFGLAAIPAIYVFWNYVMHDYQRSRLLTFLNPEADMYGEGYNLIQTRITIGSGGLFGQGYLNGMQTQGDFLKVQYSDFIFSVVAEQFGFIGGCGIMALLFILVWRCLVVASRAPDAYGSFIAVGVAVWIGMQVFIHVGMNIGLMPVTGIPLPFISYGGSSLMSILLGLGLVQSVALRSSSVIFGGEPLRAGWARSARTTLRPR
ncbi:MAG: rod shape-determining protein RodA [Chloroflexota bacterium]|nr:rod shape-determining protein RodA [Chloroflexota bacterium]MDQ5864778.1 rod shape-determining protein RodA [Chloroflexota bacterium]